VAIPPFDPDQDSAEYVYVRLANHIEARIRAGELSLGRRLPAERDQAAEYGVAYMTVRRAMKELRGRGLIRSVVGRGTYIVEELPSREAESEG
jgi:DNA-binding GntR family transcriptional regulator